MNEEVRKQIVVALKATPNRSVGSLIPEIAQATGISQEETYRTLQLMEDAGTVTYIGTGHTAIRLTLKGNQATEAKQVRFKNYMSENWIAIAALAVSALSAIGSIAGIIISIIALNSR